MILVIEFWLTSEIRCLDLVADHRDVLLSLQLFNLKLSHHVSYIIYHTSYHITWVSSCLHIIKSSTGLFYHHPPLHHLSIYKTKFHIWYTYIVGTGQGTKTDEFSENFQRGGGGGGHFKSKKLCCRFWDFKQGFFYHEIDTKESFQGSGYVIFDNCIKKFKIRHTLKKALLIPYTIYPS